MASATTGLTFDTLALFQTAIHGPTSTVLWYVLRSLPNFDKARICAVVDPEWYLSDKLGEICVSHLAQ